MTHTEENGYLERELDLFEQFSEQYKNFEVETMEDCLNVFDISDEIIDNARLQAHLELEELRTQTHIIEE